VVMVHSEIAPPFRGLFLLRWRESANRGGRVLDNLKPGGVGPGFINDTLNAALKTEGEEG
jgi:hypothetical protein